MGIDFYSYSSFDNLIEYREKEHLFFYEELREYIYVNKRYINSELNNLFSIDYNGNGEYGNEEFIKGLIKESIIILESGVLDNFQTKYDSIYYGEEAVKFFKYLIEMCENVLKNNQKLITFGVDFYNYNGIDFFRGESISEVIKYKEEFCIVWQEELQDYIYENKNFINSNLENLYSLDPYSYGEEYDDEKFIRGLIEESKEILRSNILDNIKENECLDREESINFFKSLIKLCEKTIKLGQKIIIIGD